MLALHQQGRKSLAEFAVNADARRHGGRKNLRDGAVEFLDHVQFFNAAFGQLRVSHDLGDDPVGARNFFLNNFDLLRGSGFAVAQGALERERGIIDDGQRIFDLMGEFGGEPSGGMQLSFARGKFVGFLDRQAVAVRATPARRNRKSSSATRPISRSTNGCPKSSCGVKCSVRNVPDRDC